jgi:hypothetical protein
MTTTVANPGGLAISSGVTLLDRHAAGWADEGWRLLRLGANCMW